MHEPLYGCEIVIIQYAFGCEILEYYIFQAISLIPHVCASLVIAPLFWSNIKRKEKRKRMK